MWSPAHTIACNGVQPLRWCACAGGRGHMAPATRVSPPPPTLQAHHAAQFDAVVTCFFIDTVPHVEHLLRCLRHLLPLGGQRPSRLAPPKLGIPRIPGISANWQREGE